MKSYQTKIKKYITPTAGLLWLLSFNVVLAQSTIYQKTKGPLENMINQIFGGGKNVTVNLGKNGGPSSFLTGIYVVINYLLTFIGVVFFAILIYGGYLWMFARGNQDQIEKAKRITTESIIGILIIVLARIIVEFLLNQVGQAVQVQ